MPVSQPSAGNGFRSGSAFSSLPKILPTRWRAWKSKSGGGTVQDVSGQAPAGDPDLGTAAVYRV